ncbi:Calcium/calmodulin-dependent protein kinase cmkA [Penicillium oxalicum]|uniref:Calcium/calmodulin-dependent protein kinase cmkA n=1 Tax=Penicillium oxalicum TaxID=69781 RepID=UPI0020B6522F|nr:Calcium/calmodulin-dependent protein kinase cmkA [Penicillium oxalicum]KAI2794732.1 Calcium/calmodulin-dependent protein kinase cmkA [Penicillium oxalicum]
MFNRLSGQPESYEKKSVSSPDGFAFSDCTETMIDMISPASSSPGPSTSSAEPLGRHLRNRSRGRDWDGKKVAIKIILKKNVRGNEGMVYDELEMLQKLKHPHIVSFVDWFESKDKFYIVTQLATGGELFDRICEYGKFTEKDASQTIRQVLDAVNYLHKRNIVPEVSPSPPVLLAPSVYLKPENLLYLTRDPDSELVLADFGIAKMLENPAEVLTSMAGSFGLILTLLQSDPQKRVTSEEALKHQWLTGESAGDRDPLPEIRAYIARARLRRGIEIVKLANRIEALKMHEEEDQEDIPSPMDMAAKNAEPAEASEANEANAEGVSPSPTTKKRSLSKIAKGAIFREVVLAKVRDAKENEEREKMEREAREKTSHHS